MRGRRLCQLLYQCRREADHVEADMRDGGRGQGIGTHIEQPQYYAGDGKGDHAAQIGVQCGEHGGADQEGGEDAPVAAQPAEDEASRERLFVERRGDDDEDSQRDDDAGVIVETALVNRRLRDQLVLAQRLNDGDVDEQCYVDNAEPDRGPGDVAKRGTTPME